jgi:hypothetical protein
MKIISFKERKSGGADMVYELNQEEIILLKDMAKTEGKKFTKTFCNKKILIALEHLVSKEKK